MVSPRSKPLGGAKQTPNFIYITGSDGTGKTTQARLLVEYLKLSGVNVQHLWLRFPFLFSLPLLAYARLRGYSYYDHPGDNRQGYWEFYRSRLMRTVFPWVFLLDAFLATVLKVNLPLLMGKTIVCERYVLDMVGDLSLALKSPRFHTKLPGRLFMKLLPSRSQVFILDLDIKTLRARRADLKADRILKDRLRIFRNLANDYSLQVISSKKPVQNVQAEIKSYLPEPVELVQSSGIKNRLGAAAKKAQKSPVVAVALHWIFQSMVYMDPTERWFKLGIDAAVTILGTVLLQLWLPLPAALLIAFLIAHTLNFFLNGQLFALLKNYGLVRHTYPQFRGYAQALAKRAEAEPAIQYIAIYGSLSRQAWSPTSDLDGRIIRWPGKINGIRASWFLLRERTRALFRRFPLDMYVLDDETAVDSRLRRDEEPIRLRVETEAAPELEQELTSSSEAFTVELADAIHDPTEVDPLGQPESGTAWAKRVSLTATANLFAVIFFLIAGYTFLSVLGMNVSYQDVWLLDGIELPFALMTGSYFLTLIFSRDIRRDAIVTALMTSLMFAVPAAKYAHVYASTIDAAVHFSLMRSLATSGFSEGNYYEYTPGMHILVASFAQMTGLSTTTWAKVLPSMVGGVIPLSLYMLAKQLKLTYLLAKSVVVLSALALPLMFIPQGTSYATVLIAPLLVFIILSVISKTESSRVFTILALLLLIGLIMWHSISSLLVPLVLGSSGLMAYFLSLFLSNKKWDVSWLRSISLRFVFFGIVGVVLTLAYWYFYATVLWEYFIEHVQLLISVINRERESGGNLIPQRATTLGVVQLGVVFAFYHARDAVMLAFAAIAIGATLLRLRSRKIISRPIELTYLFTTIYVIFLTIIAGAFAARFATFGYHRLLIYLLIVSPVLSGFGLWLTVLFVKRFLKIVPENLILMSLVMLAFMVSALQYYPYQPWFPKYETTQTDGTTPLQWYHQVNTDYQRYVLDFAYNRLPVEVNLYTDYIKYQQTRLFIGPDARERFRYGPWGNLTQSYVILHHPGEAGSYSEQAEYRSSEAIQLLQQMSETSIIYDNGGAFIQFVPMELMPLYKLGGER